MCIRDRYGPIQDAMNSHEHKTFLLHGVTGSGKTQLYLRATARCISQDKTAIILVPEKMCIRDSGKSV